MRPSQLKLNYNEFRLLMLKLKNEGKLNALDSEWLARWEAWNLACSPMDDSARGLIRFGHYLGFVHAREFRS